MAELMGRTVDGQALVALTDGEVADLAVIQETLDESLLVITRILHTLKKPAPSEKTPVAPVAVEMEPDIAERPQTKRTRGRRAKKRTTDPKGPQSVPTLTGIKEKVLEILKAERRPMQIAEVTEILIEQEGLEPVGRVWNNRVNAALGYLVKRGRAWRPQPRVYEYKAPELDEKDLTAAQKMTLKASPNELTQEGRAKRLELLKKLGQG